MNWKEEIWAMLDRGSVCTSMLTAGLIALALSTLVAASASGDLPDGRRYEMVTPPAKGGTDVVGNPTRVRAAADGGAVQFASLLGFGDVRGAGLSTEYVAIRGTDGTWHTHGITPVEEPTSFIPDLPNALEPRYVGELSSDLLHGVFLAKTPLTNAPNVARAINLYLRNDLLTSGAGAYQLLTDATSDQGIPYDPSLQPSAAGSSADFSHVLFESKRSLLAETIGLTANDPKLYEWVDGTLRFVGMTPTAPDTQCGGTGPACTPAPSQAGQGALTAAYTLGTVSHDGRRIIFTVPDLNVSEHAGRLYLRDDQGTPTTGDDVTLQVNASERTAPDPQQAAQFWAASRDGTKVFFTTSEKLTDEDPNISSDLYRYDQNAPQGNHLTRISTDTEPGDNQNNDLANGHTVAGALGASNDGNTVYFLAGDSVGSQLIAGGSITQPVGNGDAAPGDVRIYRWHTGVLQEVGGVNRSIEMERILGMLGWPRADGGKYSRVSPNGRYLIFVTQGTDQLLSHYGKPEYDHGNTCDAFGAEEACQEIYFYDADASNGQGDLDCASCNPTGLPAKSDALLYTVSTPGPTFDTSHLSHSLSDNGRYVFFNSGDQLVPDDKNTAVDTYEYNTVTRQVHLLSSGIGASRQIFLDASADGHDVFFLARTQLRSEDQDQSTDIYDARIGGARDPGPTIPEDCKEESCRPAATPTATARNPASMGFQGPADRLAPRSPAAFFHAALSLRQRRHLARAGAARLTVSASRGGLITTRVAARIGGKRRTIDVVHRALKDAATIRPRIRLTPAARRSLTAHGRLVLAITTTFSQTSTHQTIHVTLRT